MKLLSAILIGLVAFGSLFAGRGYQRLADAETEAKTITTTANDDFEKAVAIIKKYETLHQPRHWPLVGYGHKVLPGEKYSRTKALGEKEADALLRKDLLKNCAVFRSYGADSLILGVLAYNIGSGATLRSSVAKKLKAGDRDIYDNYVAHSRYKGKTHAQIKRRRIEEFETLFIKDPSSREVTTVEKETVVEENVEPTTMNMRSEPSPIRADQWRRGLSDRQIRNTGKAATPARRKNKIPQTYNTLTACILKSQTYFKHSQHCFC